MPSAFLVVAVSLLFVVCEFSSSIPIFYARKAVHTLTGVLCLGIEPSPSMKVIVFLFGAMTLFVNWRLRPFRFAKRNDIGMTVMAFVVVMWVMAEFPNHWLMPVYFADPLAAVVGVNISTPVWINNKSMAGSLTVFLVSFLTLGHIPQLANRLLLAVALALSEAIGGTYDNLTLFATLCAYHVGASLMKIPVN